VLRRTARLERQARRQLTARLIMMPVVMVLLVSALAFLILVGVVLDTWTLSVPAIPMVVVIALQARDWRRDVRIRRAEKQLQNLELIISSDGVEYRSLAGRFAVPWASVRRVAVTGRPDGRGGKFLPVLLVEAEDWDGPIAIFGKVSVLRMPLDRLDAAGSDLRPVAAHLPELSGGRLSLQVPRRHWRHLPIP
jgi:hypothetical protein